MSQQATLIDGKAVGAKIQERAHERADLFRSRRGRAPGLSVVLVGDDPASHVYVGRKQEAAERLGLAGATCRLPASAPREELRRVIDGLNADDTVDGILVQLPLPRHLDAQEVLAQLDPQKDVDGFHPMNVGKLQVGLPACRPCTPAGIIEALRAYEVPLAGAHAVVVGRSNIVGKPMAALLLHENATVTVCHSRTRDLPGVCRLADVLVAAVGIPGFVGPDAIKPGAVVIDVGINRIENPRDAELARRLLGEGTKRHASFLETGSALVGDVDSRRAREVASLLTPVPGGVGPLTIAMLMSNTVDAAFRRAGLPPP
jgi:methylenetetrahydrofolate dehydrogenase (NADP+)/methenyltetrahydrofolate cyclohydrolase